MKVSTRKAWIYAALIVGFIWSTVSYANDAVVDENRDYTLSLSLSTKAKPSTVWRLWSDVENWNKFDTLLEYSSLDPGAKFESGARGVIKASGNRRTRFELKDVVSGESFTEKLKVPLGQVIELNRRVGLDPNGHTVFTHEVVFKGRLRFLIYGVAAKTFKKELPLVMGRLRDLAETEELNGGRLAK